jgi:hypothetical protein
MSDTREIHREGTVYTHGRGEDYVVTRHVCWCRFIPRGWLLKTLNVYLSLARRRCRQRQVAPVATVARNKLLSYVSLIATGAYGAVPPPVAISRYCCTKSHIVRGNWGNSQLCRMLVLGPSLSRRRIWRCAASSGNIEILLQEKSHRAR